MKGIHSNMSENYPIFQYLQAMIDRKASDLYLTSGYAPAIRVEDEMVTLSDTALDKEALENILGAILTIRQRRDFEEHMEMNTALELPKFGRFRVNVLQQRQNPAIVIRRIVSTIPTIKELRLPAVLESLAMQKRGLVLLTGTTGSGKSTSLASMIDHRNSRQTGHIITVEDPIEYFHEHKKSVVTQREVGVDTESYAVALKNALRQRPDVVLIGEVRDREVMEQTLTMTDTGHLCLATIHANNAYQAIERIVNLFPDEQTNQIRLSLSMNLSAIISQRLLPGLDGMLVPALEIMLNKGHVRELILKGEVTKIKEVVEQNQKEGMCSFDQSLLSLYAQKMISEETAMMNSDKPSDLQIKIKQFDLSGAKRIKEGPLSGIDTSSFSIRD